MATTHNGTEDIHANHGVKPSIGATLLRLLQLIIALAILGMAAFVVANAAYSGAILATFVASLTTFVLLYTLLSSHRLTNIFNNWAIALLDLLLTILWLATWITAAVQIRRYRFRFGYYGCGWFLCRRDLLEWEVSDDEGVGLGLSGRGLQKRDTYWRTWRSVFIAVAVLAAVEFVLFVTSFFYTLTRILHHRDRHHHGAGAAAAGAGAGAGTQKNAADMEMQNQGQGQAGYTGQTVAGQTGAGYAGQTGADQTGYGQSGYGTGANPNTASPITHPTTGATGDMTGGTTNPV